MRDRFYKNREIALKKTEEEYKKEMDFHKQELSKNPDYKIVYKSPTFF